MYRILFCDSWNISRGWSLETKYIAPFLAFSLCSVSFTSTAKHFFQAMSCFFEIHEIFICSMTVMLDFQCFSFEHFILSSCCFFDCSLWEWRVESECWSKLFRVISSISYNTRIHILCWLKISNIAKFLSFLFLKEIDKDITFFSFENNCDLFVFAVAK